MSSILYQNAFQTVVLLDVVRSVSEGSGMPSVAAISPSEPHRSTEPKGSKRAKMLASIPKDEQRYHGKIAELARSALVEVRQCTGQRSWCLNDSMHGHLDCTTASVRQHMAETTDIATH